MTSNQVLSELATNAIKAPRSLSPAPPIRFWLLSDHTRLLILVWDANPQPPVLLHAHEDADTGRGLHLVDAISERWGYCPSDETGGKVVWSLISQ